MTTKGWLLLAGGVGGALLLFRGRGGSSGSAPLVPGSPILNGNTGVVGSMPSGEDDVEALARMLASEFSRRYRDNVDLWPWLAWVARNKAAKDKVSIFQLLTRGVKDGKTTTGLSYGPQDPEAPGGNGYTRWASTTKNPTAASLAFARKFLAGEVPDPGLKGATSFFAVAIANPASFEKRNPELVAMAEVGGWRFYKRG